MSDEYERPATYTLPLIGTVARSYADEITGAIREQNAAHRQAWEQERRDAGPVWVAVYWRYHVKYEEEYFSLEDAKSFLAYGSDSGNMAPVGVKLPSGEMLEYAYDWMRCDVSGSDRAPSYLGD